MKVLYLTAECKPFSKAGGVGDVAGELPAALQKAGVDITIVTPWYESISQEYQTESAGFLSVDYNGVQRNVEILKTSHNGVPVIFLWDAHYFGGDYSEPYTDSETIPFYDDVLRFSFFSEAAVKLIAVEKPDIVHANDWPTSFVFGLMEMQKIPGKRILTVHNMIYQGNIGMEVITQWEVSKILFDAGVGGSFIDPRKEWHSINPLKLGMMQADRVNTVSPSYADEMTQPEDEDRYFSGGRQLFKVAEDLKSRGRLIGILNGFQYPEKTAAIEDILKLKKKARAAFDLPDSQGTMLLGFVGRAAEQKLKLLLEPLDGIPVLEHILNMPDIHLAMVTSGSDAYEKKLLKYRDHPSFHLTLKHDRQVAEQIHLGCDLFLMPSLYEPCGITQMESMALATPVLVRNTGGLADTVKDADAGTETGFKFNGTDQAAILKNLIESLQNAARVFSTNPQHWNQIQQNCLNQRFSWDISARQYIETMYQPVMDTGESAD